MLPLKGLRVIALEQYGAGPFGSMHLGDLGAEIIRIENVSSKGDVSRYVPEPFMKSADKGDGFFYQSINRNKKSMSIDMKSDEGRKIFEKLVSKADVVFNNMRGDLPAKMKITYNDLKHINEKIVCVSLSGWGRTGKFANYPGYDYLVQATTGFMMMSGEPDGPPSRCGISVIDFAAGMAAAYATMAGVFKAKTTGKGLDLDTSLLQTGVSMLNYLATWNMNGDYEPERFPSSAHPTVIPTQSYETKDGWIFIMPQKDKFFDNLCLALGREDLSMNKKFAKMKDRFENKDEIRTILIEEFKNKETSEWIELLRKYNVPHAPINTVAQALESELVNQFVVEVEHEKLGTIKQLNTAVHCPGIPTPTLRAPLYGEHTDWVLASLLDYSQNEIDAFRDKRIVE
jgi:crotonobetainyl-CoA:carnitine CoA-transferase CaiB-like acyl-CoA transferase